MASLVEPRPAACFRLRRRANRSPVSLALAGRLVALTLAGALSLPASTERASAQAAAAPPSPAVVVAPVVRKPVTPTATFTGRVSAIDKVDLRARVDGYLEKRHFTEGQLVKEGDLLYVIEKQIYQAAVNQAAANVASAEAAAVNASL